MALNLVSFLLSLLAAFGPGGMGFEVRAIWLWNDVVIIQTSEPEKVDESLTVGDNLTASFVIDGDYLSVTVKWLDGVSIAPERPEYGSQPPDILGTRALPGDKLYFAIVREGRVQYVEVVIDKEASVG
ncbi:MAG: hypothetical protein ABIH88_02500 [Patescibacteria group bacterium]|nr:hypothetical protein [Patescibacteria group bacterium]